MDLSESALETPNYENWVSKKFIYAPGVTALAFLITASFFKPAIIPSILFFIIAMYFAYARHLFSPRGGNVQDQILDLVMSHLDWNGEGRALDIGCGNAPLTIKLAQEYSGARIIGIDYWGKKWDYSKKVCEKNARLAGVEKRVSFQKASAARLPFEDEYFNAAVSNLVFHEVGDVKDKREVIREALRVVKKGGRFTFQDLFLFKSVFGDPDELMTTIKSWGIEKVGFVKTREAPFIPKVLKLPFMVGTISLIYGEK